MRTFAVSACWPDSRIWTPRSTSPCQGTWRPTFEEQPAQLVDDGGATRHQVEYSAGTMKQIDSKRAERARSTGCHPWRSISRQGSSRRVVRSK